MILGSRRLSGLASRQGLEALLPNKPSTLNAIDSPRPFPQIVGRGRVNSMGTVTRARPQTNKERFHADRT